ncbi:MAG: hypothetical protein R2765_03105 [Ferruginibacter sp.]
MTTNSSGKGVILSLRSYSNIKFVLEADDGDELIEKIPEFVGGCNSLRPENAKKRWN